MNASESKQFALGAIFLATLMTAVLICLAVRFELQGFAIAVDVCVVLWTLASFSDCKTLRPFSNRLTIIEIGTLVGICLILHGLAMPSVQSGPHFQRNTPRIPAPTISEPTSSDITP